MRPRQGRKLARRWPALGSVSGWERRGFLLFFSALLAFPERALLCSLLPLLFVFILTISRHTLGRGRIGAVP